MKSLNYWLFLLVTALLPFPQFILRPVMVAWCVAWLLEGRFFHRPQWSKTQLPFLLFGLWFLLNALSVLWAPDKTLVWKQLERYLSFIILLPIAIWGVNERYDWKTICRVFVCSTLISVGVFLLAAFWCYNAHFVMDGEHVFKTHYPSLNDTIAFFSFFKHRLYYGTILLLALFASIYLHADRVLRKGTLIAWLQTAGSCTVFAGAILLTASRANLFAGAALAVIAMMLNLPHRHRWLIRISTVAVGLCAVACAFFLHPRMQNLKDEPRLQIWNIALEHPADYNLHGLGAGQSVPYLVERYQQAELPVFVHHRYNAHNQFLNEWMELGIGGLVLFVVALGSMLFCCKTDTKKSATLIVTLFALNMLTECMFGRFDGIAIWAVGMVLVLLVKSTE